MKQCNKNVTVKFQMELLLTPTTGSNLAVVRHHRLTNYSKFSTAADFQKSHLIGRDRTPYSHEMVSNNYLPLDGMINIPIYLVWGCWVQFNSNQFVSDHIIYQQWIYETRPYKAENGK